MRPANNNNYNSASSTSPPRNLPQPTQPTDAMAGRKKTTKTATPTAGEAPEADQGRHRVRTGTILACIVAFVAIAIGGVILSTSENVESNEQLKSAFDEFYAANVQPLVGDTRCHLCNMIVCIISCSLSCCAAAGQCDVHLQRH